MDVNDLPDPSKNDKINNAFGMPDDTTLFPRGGEVLYKGHIVGGLVGESLDVVRRAKNAVKV